MAFRLQAITLQAKNPDGPLSDAHALYRWFTHLTGEDINVEVLHQEKKRFKMVLYTTDEQREAHLELLGQHFWVS